MAEAGSVVSSLSRSDRVCNLLNEVVTWLALRSSQEEEGIRTRMKTEQKKEEAARWVDIVFRSVRWCVERRVGFPRSEVLVMMLVDRTCRRHQEVSDVDDRNRSVTLPEDVTSIDILAAEKLVSAAEISIDEDEG